MALPSTDIHDFNPVGVGPDRPVVGLAQPPVRRVDRINADSTRELARDQHKAIVRVDREAPRRGFGFHPVDRVKAPVAGSTAKIVTKLSVRSLA